MNQYYIWGALVALSSSASASASASTYASTSLVDEAASSIPLAKQSEEQKAAKKAEAERKQAEKEQRKADAAYRHRLVLANQYLNRAEKSAGSDDEARSVKLALEQYDMLTTEDKKRPEAIEFQTRYQAAKARSDKNIKDNEEKTALVEKRGEADRRYNSQIRELERAIFQLQPYRDPTAKPDSGFANWHNRFATIQQAMPGLETLAAECDKTYIPLLATGSPREQVLANCDTAKNRLDYRERFVVGNANGAVSEQVKAYTEAIQTLSGVGCWTGFYADHITNYERTYRAIVDPVTSAYRAIGKPVPESELAKIPAAKAQYEAAFRTALNRNKRSTAQYAYSIASMKSALDQASGSAPVSYLMYGMAKNQWTVEKAKLTGIPLHQRGDGTVLLKRSGDSFCREYKVAFFKDFTGSGYTDINRVEISQAFVPLKCP